jgi:IS30 family transposase
MARRGDGGRPAGGRSQPATATRRHGEHRGQEASDGPEPGARNISDAERLEIRWRARAGQPNALIAATLGRERWVVGKVLGEAGGLMPRRPSRSPLRLSLAEREEISRGLRAGESYRAIARRLGRAPSTIAREVGVNHGRARYPAWRAELGRDRRARRPRTASLARLPRMRIRVEELLGQRWSSQQIAGYAG